MSSNFFTLQERQQDSLETGSKRVLRRTAEATGDLVGNNKADKNLKSDIT